MSKCARTGDKNDNIHGYTDLLRLMSFLDLYSHMMCNDDMLDVLVSWVSSEKNECAMEKNTQQAWCYAVIQM